MRVGFVMTGFALLLVATGLQAVGQHDGVLNATPAEAFPVPGQPARPVLTRLVVDGTPETTRSYIDLLSQRGGLDLSALPVTDSAYVTAHFSGQGPATVVLLESPEPVPSVGDIVVVEGAAHSVVFAFGPEGAVELLWIQAEQVREPILFKEG